MTSYKELYLYLFRQIADAVEDLERGRTSSARERLIHAQQQAEEAVMAQEDLPETK